KRELLKEISNGTLFGENKASFLARIFRPETVAGAMTFDTEKIRAARGSGPLFLDNPFNGLDEHKRADLAKTLKEKSEAVIFTTANFDDVLAAADRAAVLAKGYLQQ